METPLTGAPMPVVAPQPLPTKPPQYARRWVWVLAGVVVCAAFALGAYWWYILPGQSDEPAPGASATPAVMAGAHVQWQTWQRYVDGPDFLTHGEPCKPLECEEVYRIGTFVAGPYKDGALFAVYNLEGMGGGFPHLFVTMPDGRRTLLERDGEQVWTEPGQQHAFLVDRDYAIPELQFPELLTSPDGKLVLERLQYSFFGPPHRWEQLASQSAGLIEVFTDPVVGTVYTDRVLTSPLPANAAGYQPSPGYYGFYVRMPNDLVALYKPRMGILDAKGGVSSIRWNPGIAPGSEYIETDFGGCGATNIVAVVQPYDVTRKDLVEIGRSSSNEPILGFGNPQHPYLRDLYETQYYVIEPEQKVAYENFVNWVPVFFWQDPLGRLVKFRNKMFIPPAECGKPVIYLYPEQTTRVSVTVEPVGGMSFSEPSYNDGWTVTAQPDGSLTDASGVRWPYLFWEGRGGLYAQPERGWVVARADVDSFLDQKLAALGLVAGEIADFKGFWLPRMQGAPYYFVTFLGNRAMDELAPLSVNPAPDTVIRVLMDFSPLTEPKTVEPFVIRTPTRTGFTVVEWGGVIR